MSSDLISLHIGDRILEVNGTPVKDQPIESIENLIQHSDTVLQVILLSRTSYNANSTEISATYCHHMLVNYGLNIETSALYISADHRARSRCSIAATDIPIAVRGDVDVHWKSKNEPGE